MFGALIIIATKGMKSISTHNILEHTEFIMSAILVGILLVISEFLAITVHLKDFLRYTGFHLFVWISIPFSAISIINLIISIRVCLIKKFKVKNTYFIKLIFISLIFIFLIHIYCYALPTFLFLLVYPTKVITILAYMITFVFVATVMFSISVHITIQRYRYHTIDHGIDHGLHQLRRSIFIFMMIIYCIVFLILLFAIVIILLYALVLGEASAISTGLYTVLSLIPTAVISVVSWMFKNKVFSNTSSANKNKESEEKMNENVDEEQSATHNGVALTVFVNENTPINRNDQEVETYGAAAW